MKFTILPKTPKGKWTVGLIIASLVLGVAGNRISDATGFGNGDSGCEEGA